LYLLALAVGHYLIHEYFYSCVILLALIIYSYDNIRSFSSDRFGKLGNQLVPLLVLTFYSYKEYERYTNDKILFSYSKEFNHCRQKLGIPVIPASWQVKSKGYKDIEWQSKKSIIGHDEKLIVLTTDYKIEFETDDYKLKPQDTIERNLYVRYIYATGKHPDTLDYSYAVGDSVRSITRQVADSILNAARIQKDY